MLMVIASASAIALRPSTKLADERPPVDLKAMIPAHFGDWHEEQQTAAYVVNPQQSEVINEIYADTLNRTYRDAKTGQAIMLSVAYGLVQNKQSQVHRPDVCYPAQGFKINRSEKQTIKTPFGLVPVRRLVTQLGTRLEPLTYWIRVGNRLADGWLEQKYAIVIEGLAGQVPDGLIFRVSSINPDASASFAQQDHFITDLLGSLSTANRRFLLGDPQGSDAGQMPNSH